jgi:hypothetical protein
MTHKSYYHQNIAMPKNSFLATFCYTPESKELFIVLAKTGRRYKYLNVPDETFQAIMEARNKGSYIAQNIIGKFQCEEMKPVPPRRPEKDRRRNPASGTKANDQL